MAGLRVAKFCLGKGALSQPVILVTPSRPPSSLLVLAVWQPAVMRTAGGCTGAVRCAEWTSHPLWGGGPAEPLWPIALSTLRPGSLGGHSSMAAIRYSTEGLLKYLKIFFNNTFFPNKEDR